MQKPKKKTVAPSKQKTQRKRPGSDNALHKGSRKTQPQKVANKSGGLKEEGARINRYLASCGLCSRREADRWIEEGRVSLNGKKVAQPGVKIGEHDVVAVDGKTVAPAANQTYILYNKPRGLLCSRKDAKGRPLIYDNLDIPANVQSIGRLDMDSEGLLLLTDNGSLAQNLIHPAPKSRASIVYASPAS